MPRQYFMPNSEDGKAAAFEQFRDNIAPYVATFGLAAGDITQQVDRGDGKGFVMLTFYTTPGYTDSTPFPAAPTKWTYRAIYRVGDAREGQWSKETSVMVGG